MDENIPMTELTFSNPVSSSSSITTAEQNAGPQWCDQCRQYAHKTDQRYQKTFNMIKKKIIFTDNLIEMYAQAKKQLEDSQQRIKTLEQESKRNEIDNQLIKAQLKAVLADKNPTLLDQQTKEIDLLKQVNENLNDQIKSMEMTRKMLEDKIVDLREELGQIDINWKKHNRVKDQLNKEVAKLKKVVQSLEKANGLLKKKNEVLQERLRMRRSRASGSFSQNTDSEHNVTAPSDDPQKTEDGAQQGEVFKSPLPEKKKKFRKKHRKSLTTDPSDDDESTQKTSDRAVVHARISRVSGGGDDVSSSSPSQKNVQEKEHKDDSEKKEEVIPTVIDDTSPPKKATLVATDTMKARILEKKKQRALRSFLHHHTGTQLKEMQSLVISLKDDNTSLVEEKISKFCQRHCLVGHERQVVKKLINLHKKSADKETLGALQQFLQRNSTGDSSSAAEQSSQEEIKPQLPPTATKNINAQNEAISTQVNIQVASFTTNTEETPGPSKLSDDADMPVLGNTEIDPSRENESDTIEKNTEPEKRHINNNLCGETSIFSSDDDDNEDITAQINSVNVRKSDATSPLMLKSPTTRSRSRSKSLSGSDLADEKSSPRSPVKPRQSRNMRTRSISKSLSEASNPPESQDTALSDAFVHHSEDEKMHENISSSDSSNNQPDFIVSSEPSMNLPKSTDALKKDVEKIEVEERDSSKRIPHTATITTFVSSTEEDKGMVCESVNTGTNEMLQFSTAKKRKATSDREMKDFKKVKVVSRKRSHTHAKEKGKKSDATLKKPEKVENSAKVIASSDEDSNLEEFTDECIDVSQPSPQRHPILSSMKSLPFTVDSLSPNTLSSKALDGNFEFLPKTAQHEASLEDDVSVSGQSTEEHVPQAADFLDLSDILLDMTERIPTLPISPLRSNDSSTPSLEDDVSCPRTEDALPLPSVDEYLSPTSHSKADEDSRPSVSPSADLCTAFSFSSGITESTTSQEVAETTSKSSKNFKKLKTQKDALSSLLEDTRQGSAFNINDAPRRFSCEAPVQARPIPTVKPVAKAQSLDPALLGDFSNVSTSYNNSNASMESLVCNKENPPDSLTVLTHKTSGPFKVVASNSFSTDGSAESDSLDVATTSENFVEIEEKSNKDNSIDSSEDSSEKVQEGNDVLATAEDSDLFPATEEQDFLIPTVQNNQLRSEEDFLSEGEEFLMSSMEEDSLLFPLGEIALLSPIKDADLDPVMDQHSLSEEKENLHPEETNEDEMHQEQTLPHREKSDSRNLEAEENSATFSQDIITAVQTAKQARVSVRLTRLPSEVLQKNTTSSSLINCDEVSCSTKSNDDSGKESSPEKPIPQNVFQTRSDQNGAKIAFSSQAAILASIQSFGVMDPITKKFPALPVATIIQWLAAMARQTSEETPECVLTPYLDVMDDVGDLGIKDLLPDFEYHFVMMIVAVDELRSERGKGITEAQVIPTALKILCRYGKSISSSPSIFKDDGTAHKVMSPILTQDHLNKAQTASLVRIFVSLCRSVGCARGPIDICRYVSLTRSFGDISHILYDCIACYPVAFSKHFPLSGKLVIYTIMFEAERYFMDNKRPGFKENICAYVHLLEKLVGWSDDENTSRLVKGKHSDSRWKKIFDTCVSNIEHARLNKEEFTKIVDGTSKMDVMTLSVQDMDDVFLSLEFLSHQKSLTFVAVEVIEKKFWLWLNEWSRHMITSKPTDGEESKPVSDACMMATLRGLSSVLSVLVTRQQTRHPGQPVVNQAVSYFETLCMVLQNLSSRYLKKVVTLHRQVSLNGERYLSASCHVQCSVVITVLRLFVCKPQAAYVAVNAWLVATRDACSMSTAARKKQKHPFLPQLVALCPEKTLRKYVHRIEEVTKPQRQLSLTTPLKTLLWGRS